MRLSYLPVFADGTFALCSACFVSAKRFESWRGFPFNASEVEQSFGYVPEVGQRES